MLQFGQSWRHGQRAKRMTRQPHPLANRRVELDCRESGPHEKQNVKLWIDTDLGTDVDDALALAYALKHPEIALVGVSTVSGDVALRTRMVNELLKIGGHPEVPVVTGLGKPISDGREGVMFGREGIGLLEDPSPRSKTRSDPSPDAQIDALAEALSRSDAEALVAIGPMTNLGALSRAGGERFSWMKKASPSSGPMEPRCPSPLRSSETPCAIT